MFSFSQIQFDSPNCNRPAHDGEMVRAVCLKEGCTEVKAVCFKCIIELHKNCIPQIKPLETINKLLEPFFETQLEIAKLQQNNVELGEVIGEIEVVLKPIQNYAEHPNLKNLNELGSFLQESLTFQKHIKQLLEGCKEQQKIKGTSKQPAIQQNPQTPEALLNQGSALYKLNRYEEAIKCFEDAIKIDPKHPDAWFLKGLTLSKVNRLQEAIISLEQVIKIDPNNQNAINSLKKVQQRLKK